MSEITRDLEKEAQRGKRADQILNDNLVKEALYDIRMNMYDKISKSNFSQKDEREDCYRMLRAIESFEGMFKKHINKGKLAEESLKKKVARTLSALKVVSK